MKSSMTTEEVFAAIDNPHGIYTKIWSKTQLTSVEKEIIKRHYGFYDRKCNKHSNPQKLEDIAVYMNTDLKTIKAIHDRVIEKFRETVRENNIEWRGRTL